MCIRDRYRIAQKAYAEARKKRELFEQEHNMKELAAVEKCPYSLDELNSMIRDVDELSLIHISAPLHSEVHHIPTPVRYVPVCRDRFRS